MQARNKYLLGSCDEARKACEDAHRTMLAILHAYARMTIPGGNVAMELQSFDSVPALPIALSDLI